MRNCLVRKSEAGDTICVRLVSSDSLPDVLKELGPQANDWVRAHSYDAAPGAILLVPTDEAGKRIVLFGCACITELDSFVLGAALSGLPAGVYELPASLQDPELACLGFALSCYRFDRYKAIAVPSTKLMVPGGVDLERLGIILDGVRLARDLVNIPANDMGPEELATTAKELFEQHGGQGEIIIGDDLLEHNFPLVHAVGRASDRAPRLADFSWGDEKAPKVTLVGKGVVFDTGGLDIKPPSSMLLMKKDMGGAANVLGLASMIMAAKLPVRLRVIIPCVENSIAGSAYRPGDILPSRKGLTVEIGNTDAEGRLVLADALTLADEEKPAYLIDMATLTGAARVALGPDLPPFYTNDEDFAEEISMMSEASVDPLWRMPLWAPYLKYLDSKVADISHINTTGAGFAGSVTAALFLSRFVEHAAHWAHFDIFAWTPIEKPGKPQGGEAQAIRCLFDLFAEKYGAKQ